MGLSHSFNYRSTKASKPQARRRSSSATRGGVEQVETEVDDEEEEDSVEQLTNG